MKKNEHDELIYHITTPNAWQQALAVGQYKAASLTEEGFIHCSTREQVVDTANSYYAKQKGLVLLEIDTTLLESELCYEPAVNGNEYPHIYGPIFVEAVTRVYSFSSGVDGKFEFPHEGVEQTW